MFKVNSKDTIAKKKNKDNSTKSLALFSCLIVNFKHIPHFFVLFLCVILYIYLIWIITESVKIKIKIRLLGHCHNRLRYYPYQTFYIYSTWPTKYSRSCISITHKTKTLQLERCKAVYSKRKKKHGTMEVGKRFQMKEENQNISFDFHHTNINP